MLNTRLNEMLNEIIETYEKSDDVITKSQLMMTLKFIKTYVETPTDIYRLIDDSSWDTDYYVLIKSNQRANVDTIQKVINTEREKWYVREENEDLDTPYGEYGAWGNYITDYLYDRYNADIISIGTDTDKLYY